MTKPSLSANLRFSYQGTDIEMTLQGGWKKGRLMLFVGCHPQEFEYIRSDFSHARSLTEKFLAEIWQWKTGTQLLLTTETIGLTDVAMEAVLFALKNTQED